MNHKLTFKQEDFGGMLTNDQLVSIFWNSFFNEFESAKDSEIYRKVSGERNQVNFDMSVFLDHRDYRRNPDITRLNEPKLIADILTKAQQCRLINGAAYEIVERLKLDEEYVVSNLGKPLIRIMGTPPDKSSCIYRPTRFESYDGKNSFSHTPQFPERKVDLELSIRSEEHRAILEHSYRATLQHHKDAGFTLTK